MLWAGPTLVMLPNLPSVTTWIALREAKIRNQFHRDEPKITQDNMTISSEARGRV